MSLHQQIKDDLKQAMKNKEQTKVSVLRNISSEITNALVAGDQTPQDELDDENVQQVIERLAKQRRESIEQYRSNDRAELADQEQSELAVLEEYLPEKMGEDEIRTVVNAKIKELGITDPSGMGQLMGLLMQELKGKADGGDVKRIAEEELNG